MQITNAVIKFCWDSTVPLILKRTVLFLMMSRTQKFDPDPMLSGSYFEKKGLDGWVGHEREGIDNDEYQAKVLSLLSTLMPAILNASTEWEINTKVTT